MSFFDIIIPTHGNPHLLLRALRSIKRQNFDDYRLIIISDDPSSQTLSAIQHLLREQDVFVQRCSATGPSASRNLALRLVSAEFVLFLDDDDTYVDNFLVILHQHLVLAVGNLFVVDFDFYYEHRGEKFADVYKIVRILEDLNGIDWRNLLVKNFLPNNALVYRASAIEGKFFDDYIGYEDWDFLLSVFVENDIVYIPVRGVNIHKMDYALSDTRGAKTRMNVLETFIHIYRKWKTEDSFVLQKRKDLFESVELDYLEIFPEHKLG
jgi:glycosyltransferase involved in cell wall biosynthesis